MFRRILFSLEEIMAIEGFLRDVELKPEQQQYISFNRELILKFGDGVVEQGCCDIPLEDIEIWELREIIPIGLKSGSKAIGLDIKKKLYQSLIDIRNQIMLDGLGLEATFRGITDGRDRDTSKDSS